MVLAPGVARGAGWAGFLNVRVSSTLNRGPVQSVALS